MCLYVCLFQMVDMCHTVSEMRVYDPCPVHLASTCMSWLNDVTKSSVAISSVLCRCGNLHAFSKIAMNHKPMCFMDNWADIMS